MKILVLTLVLLVSIACASPKKSKSSVDGDSQRRSDGDVSSLLQSIDEKMNKICWFTCNANEAIEGPSCKSYCGYSPFD